MSTLTRRLLTAFLILMLAPALLALSPRKKKDQEETEAPPPAEMQVDEQQESAEKTKKPAPRGKEFFAPEETVTQRDQALRELQQEVRAMEDELNRLRLRLGEYEDLSTPRIREEIKRLINYPEQISEIRLSNGTVVQGRILSENLDRVVVQTSLGMLSIEQENIVALNPYDKLHADVKLQGEYEEQQHSDKRVYIGVVRNEGLRRADFVRVLFRLHDKRTQIIAQDSGFVNGSEYTFFSGVISESSLEPNAAAEFRVEVPLPKDFQPSQVSYRTYKILYDEFE